MGLHEERIKITGDTQGIEETIVKLEKLGTTDKNNAEQFKKSQQEYTDAAVKRKFLIESETKSLATLYDKRKKAFDPADIASFNAAISESKARIETLNGVTEKTAKSFNNVVKEVSGIGPSVSKAYGALRTLANIIPGLGISGIILLGYETLIDLVKSLSGGFDENTKAVKINNEAIEEQIKKRQDLQAELEKAVTSNLLAQGIITKTDKEHFESIANYEKKIDDLDKDRITNAIKLANELGIAGDQFNSDQMSKKFKEQFKLTPEEIEQIKRGLEEATTGTFTNVDTIKKKKEELTAKMAAFDKAQEPSRRAAGLTLEEEKNTIDLNAYKEVTKAKQKIYDKAAADRKRAELAEFDRMYKLASKQLDEINKLKSSGETEIEKETRQYKERLIAAGIYYKQRYEMTDAELAASEALERDYNARILKIEQETADKILKQKIENLHNEYRALEIVAKQALADKKLSREDYNLQVDQLELAEMEKQLVLEQEAGKESVKLELDIADKKIKIKEDEAARKAAIDKQALEGIKNYVQGAAKLYTELIEARIKGIDHEEGLVQNSIEQQMKLAEAGKANTLAFELKRQSDLEKQRQQEQKKLIKVKELETFLNSVAEFSKQDPKTAIFKAIAQMGLVKAAEAAYMEEGGLIGGDNKRSTITGGVFSRIHPGGGDRLIHAQTGEGLLSRKNISNMGGEKAFVEFQQLLNNPIREIAIPSSSVMMSMSTKALEAKLDNLEKTIRDKKETSVNFESMGGALKMIVEENEKGIKRVTEHYLTSVKLRK